MLDVHSPHETAHSWKDFLIHIATICVGLLIAIGLEQSVEYGHHRHQAHQLEQDMFAEAESNVQIIDKSQAGLQQEDVRFASFIKAARNAPENGGYVSFVVPPAISTASKGSHINFHTVPSRGVWTVATAQGLVNLLPHEKAQIYNRLDYEAAEAMHIETLLDVNVTKTRGALRSISDSATPGETLHMSAAQRDKLVDALSENLDLRQWYEVRLALWKGASEAVLHDAPTMTDMFPYIYGEAAKVPKR